MFGGDKKLKKLRKESEELTHVLRKFRIYQRDVLEAEEVEELINAEIKLHEVTKTKKWDELEPAVKKARKLRYHHCPASSWDWVTENVEVAVVAIVIALAIRTYFLQPFTIPTGSMEPSLNGDRITQYDDPFPSWPVQFFERWTIGRTYAEVKAKNGGEITNLQSGQYFLWFEYTDLYINGQPHRIWANNQAVMKYLRATGQLGIKVDALGQQKFEPLVRYQPGQTIIRAVIDEGDYVLVNKMAYHFFRPAVGDVFVFTTASIPMLQESRQAQGFEGSQYYIKRCTGLPGQTLAIEPPRLLIDGKPVEEPPIFQAIYSMKNGYNGYVIPEITPSTREALQYLAPAGKTYILPANHFWAMGDNSRASLDSRFWGGVPRKDLSGTAWMVYWPFTSHWGWIK